MEISRFREEFLREIYENREITGLTFEEELFDTYVNYLSENDELIGETNFLHFEMPLTRNQRASISGYSYNELDRVLSLIIIDEIDSIEDISSLTLTEGERLYKRARNFYTHAKEISEDGEESNEAINLAYTLNDRKLNEYNQFFNLSHLKIFIFTEKLLSNKLFKTEDEIVEGLRISKQYVGIERIQSFANSRKGKVELEIDLTKFEKIPAILANETNEYESYLCNINGLTLARLYNEYGSRLIESNVRSFLQTKGKVNKGIRLTILKEPEKFFAYNNGLTCTAKSINFIDDKIEHIVGLQIVNGGQTTASLANVLLNEKGGKEKLIEVSVPMKLNVIKNSEIEDEFVADISRYANSQNKVSEVDLASNHPFHKKIEELSRKTSTPASDGFSHGTYWYYERAAGQYSQETYKMTKSHRNRFFMVNPRFQMFKKSDFAKYYNIYTQHPDIASRGGVASFKTFSSWIIKVWDSDKNSINQEFYKEMISNIIMFKELDKLTRNGAGSNGYKANINAYTLSYLYWYLENKKNVKFDYTRVWQKQTVPEKVLTFLDDVSFQVRDELTKTEGNVTEYAKKQYCWEEIKKNIVIDKDYDLSSISISKIEAKESKILARKDEKFNNDLDDVTKVYRKIEQNNDYYKNLLNFLDENIKEFNYKERDLVAKLATNKYLTDKQCKIVLQVIDKAELEGFGLD